MKNCDPLVFGPLFAIETTPRTLCWKKKKINMNEHPWKQDINLYQVLSDLLLSSMSLLKPILVNTTFYHNPHYNN